MHFGRKTVQNAEKPGRLYTSPLKIWGLAITKLKQCQEKSVFHKAAVIAGNYFVSVMQQTKTPVHQKLDSAYRERVEKNR